MFRSKKLNKGEYEIYYNARWVGNFVRAKNGMWFFKPFNATTGKSYTIRELGDLQTYLRSLLGYN